MSPEGSIVGCDFSGVVQQVGEDVTVMKIGDRVAGFVHGDKDQTAAHLLVRPSSPSNHQSFDYRRLRTTDYVTTEAILVWKVPENISPEEAAALGGIGPGEPNVCLFF